MATDKGKGLKRLASVFSRSGRGGRGQAGSQTCHCPECGYSVQHTKGAPCSSIECPRCATPLRGENC